MFRSLANLTAHKRSYCLDKFEDVTHIFSSKVNCEAAQLRTVIVEGETIETVVPEDNLDTENYSPSLDLLKDAGIISTIEDKPSVNRLLPPKKASLSSVVDKLAAKRAAEYLDNANDKVDIEDNNAQTDAVYMEPMSHSVKAQFQSYSTGFKYREIQALNNAVSLVVGPDGKSMEVTSKDQDRTKSPTNSEESKENMMDDDYDPNAPVDDNGNTVKYPCPECKKGFSKVGNVYKHLSNHHGKTKAEYTNLRQLIQDNAYVVDKADGVERPQKAALQNLALAIGLVNKQGVGMQKINKPPEKQVIKTEKDNTLADLQAPRRGRPPKTRNPDALQTDNVKNGNNDDDSDTEASFNPGSLSPEGQDHGGGGKGKKRKRTESSRTPITNAWRGGNFQCVLCDRSFGTPTFLMQHYVSPHFSRELRNEFGPHLGKKRCPQCKSSFDTETKLLMHLGCTHREVHKYLPSNAKDLMPGVRAPGSPAKVIKTPMRGPTPDLFQKFTANIVKSDGKPDKKSSPKSAGSLIPQLKDEFIS